MRRRSRLTGCLVGLGVVVAAIAASRPASAQLEALDEGVAVGEWTFFPSLEVRLRGEYRRHPVDTGGDIPVSTALLVQDYSANGPPVSGRLPEVVDQWLISERSRLGLAVEWQALRGVFVLEDARVLGMVPGSVAALDTGGFGQIAPFEAYLAVMAPDPDDEEDWRVEARLGRQQIVWGDGRLLGESDWAHRGHSLDAARLAMRFGDVEIEGFGALLQAPGALPPDVSTATPEPALDGGWGTGAQLYGLDAVWHALPLLNVELAALARIVREPASTMITPGDTYVFDGRVFGDQRGWRYAAEGAYQLGRVASIGAIRDVSAFAFAGNVSWLTALPWDFEFGVDGAYASGNDAGNDADSSLSRFDPIFPEVHGQHGMMDLAAWSNLIAAGGFVGAHPFEEGRLQLGFHFLGLAEPSGRWTTATLQPVGAASDNGSHVLGYQGDLRFALVPWDPLELDAGYGLMVLGTGGRNVLAAAGRGDPNLLHLAYLQAKLQVP